VPGCARRERKPRFPKGKKAKHRDPAADGGGAASFDIDSVMNPELATERRARQRHQREKDDKQGSTAEVKVFEVRYDVCPASPRVPPLYCWQHKRARCNSECVHLFLLFDRMPSTLLKMASG
jgi:hypothetical protein